MWGDEAVFSYGPVAPPLMRLAEIMSWSGVSDECNEMLDHGLVLSKTVKGVATTRPVDTWILGVSSCRASVLSARYGHLRPLAEKLTALQCGVQQGFHEPPRMYSPP